MKHRIFTSLLILFLAAIPLFTFKHAVFAADRPFYLQTAQDFIDNFITNASDPNNPPNALESGVSATQNSMWVSAILAIMGCDSQSNPACSGTAMDARRSVLAQLGNTTVAMYQNPPASTYAFVSDLGHTLGFMPKAEAQGIGFAGLSVLLPIWKAFRNIAYALLSIILIAVGFMVMFRKKIDPKTVVTVQSAIPRIVIALLLVTFSYAIVGFMIDLMYLGITLSISVISGATGGTLGKAVTFATSPYISAGPVSVGSPASGQQVTNSLFNGGIGGILKFFFGSGFQAWDDIAAMFTGGLSGGGVAKALLIPGLIGLLIGGGKGLVTGLVSAPALLTLIILIILIFGFIRLIFMLLDAYINIIISLIVAPFQLMLVAVPGTHSFETWFRYLLSKILVFPITAILLMLAALLTSQDYSKSIWAPPMLASGDGVYGMAGLIGLGMLLITPSVVANLTKALKAEAFIPGGVSTIVGPLGQGVGQLMSYGYYGFSIASMFRHKPDTRTPLQVGREGAEKGFGALTGGGGGGH